MMSGVPRSAPSVGVPDEQLVEPLLPDVATESVAVPPPLPVLPPLTLPAVTAELLLDVAVIDRSGRFSARGLLAALGWRPGDRVAIDAVHGAAVISPAVTYPAAGRSRIGARGELAVQAPVRALCGLSVGEAVVLAACPSQQRLIVHPAHTVARLLADYHARLTAGDDDDR